MKLAYTTTFSAQDVASWSGTPFYMANAFKEAGTHVDYIGSLSPYQPPVHHKMVRFIKKVVGKQRNSMRFDETANKFFSTQVATQLKKFDTDAVLAPLPYPITYLECKQPIILWTDATFAGLVGFHEPSTTLSADYVNQANRFTKEYLRRCRLAIFSSDWAARSAIERYGVDKNKVKVVPYGANIVCQHNIDDIRILLKMRSRKIIKFLFLAKHWERKGGDIVLKVIKALHTAGMPVELHIVGYPPPAYENIPSYVKCHGFVAKDTIQGIEKITRLLRDSHFLFVPTRAEAYGIVFCEANAFGVPCLSSYVGGVSTIVKDNINGMTFALDASIQTYCDYICDLIQNYSRYEELALSAFNQYQTRLNWGVAIHSVKKLIEDVL